MVKGANGSAQGNNFFKHKKTHLYAMKNSIITEGGFYVWGALHTSAVPTNKEVLP